LVDGERVKRLVLMSKFVQPTSRIFTTNWTPQLLKAAFSQAEAGNFRLAADICDGLLADDRYGSVTETRTGGLLGLPLSFEASGDGRKRRKVVHTLEAQEDWWEAFPDEELKQLMKWALTLGFCWAQLVPTKHDGRLVPKLEFWHPRNTRLDTHTGQWYAKIDDGSREVPIVAGDGQWLFYAPWGVYRPWASGLWRGLKEWWLLKQYAEMDAGRKSEKSGLISAESDPEEIRTENGTEKKVASSAMRRQLADEIQKSGRNGVLVPPSGVVLKLLDSKETIAQNQGAIVDMANIAYAVAVLGQNLTTEVSGGSYAAAKVHDKVEIQRIRFDALTAAKCLHDQALEWWAQANFGDEKLAPWPVWQTDAPTDQKERASVLYTLSQALEIFDRLGIVLDDEDLKVEFSIEFTRAPKPEPPVPPALPGQVPPGQEPPNPEDGQDPVDGDPVDPEAEPPADATEPPAEPVPPKPKGKAAKAKLEAAARALAHDHVDDAAPPVHPGQAYTDRLSRQLELRNGMRPTVNAVLDAVRGAKTFAEAFDAVTRAYEGLEAPVDLAAATDAALLLADLGGRLEVNENPEV
jgi:hypothetical protein